SSACLPRIAPAERTATMRHEPEEKRREEKRREEKRREENNDIKRPRYACTARPAHALAMTLPAALLATVVPIVSACSDVEPSGGARTPTSAANRGSVPSESICNGCTTQLGGWHTLTGTGRVVSGTVNGSPTGGASAQVGVTREALITPEL